MSAPTITAAAVPSAGTTLALTLSATVGEATVTGFAVSINGTYVPYTGTAAATTITLTFGTGVKVASTDTVKYSYSSTTGNVTDNAANVLATIAATSATNSSTQTGTFSFQIGELAVAQAIAAVASTHGATLAPATTGYYTYSGAGNILRSDFATATKGGGATYAVNGGAMIDVYDSNSLLLSRTFIPAGQLHSEIAASY
jgi:hypothetical protein